MHGLNQFLQIVYQSAAEAGFDHRLSSSWIRSLEPLQRLHTDFARTDRIEFGSN